MSVSIKMAVDARTLPGAIDWISRARKFKVAAAISLSMTALSENSLSCESEVRAFLSEPNTVTMQALEQRRPDGCWQRAAELRENFSRLIVLVASGNDVTARYLAARLSLTDGGELEDALISLGQYSDRKMQRLMRLVVEKRVSEAQFANAIASLPLSLTDDFDAQLSLIAARRRAAVSVTDASLSQPRVIALNILEKGSLKLERRSRRNSGTSNVGYKHPRPSGPL